MALAKIQAPWCSQALMRKPEIWTIMQNALSDRLWPFKPFCRLSLTSDLRWSTKLFITHLIVNERKCNQQLLSTLYMESRRLLSPEKMWPLMKPREFLLHPLPLLGEGCQKENRIANMMKTPCLRTHCCHRGSPAAEASVWNFDWMAFNFSEKCCIF